MIQSHPPALSKYSRPEASFSRTHTGELETSPPPLQPLWKDLLAGGLMLVVIGILLVML